MAEWEFQQRSPWFYSNALTITSHWKSLRVKGVWQFQRTSIYFVCTNFKGRTKLTEKKIPSPKLKVSCKILFSHFRKRNVHFSSLKITAQRRMANRDYINGGVFNLKINPKGEEALLCIEM